MCIYVCACRVLEVLLRLRFRASLCLVWSLRAYGVEFGNLPYQYHG